MREACRHHGSNCHCPYLEEGSPQGASCFVIHVLWETDLQGEINLVFYIWSHLYHDTPAFDNEGDVGDCLFLKLT